MKTLVALLVALTFLAGYAGFSGQPADVPAPLSETGADEPESREAIIEAIMMDDLPAHRVLFPGRDGTSIYIMELHIMCQVENGYALFDIPDHIWYDHLEPIPDETMTITLTPFENDSSGALKQLQAVSYSIDIPLSPVTLVTPGNLRTVVASSIAHIIITVRPGSTVTVNGEDCSDTVNPDTGEMNYRTAVKPIGDNVFDIVVRSPFCRENTLQVVLYREPQEIPIDFAASIYDTTNQSVMKVGVTTLPGASVEVSTPYTDLDISQLDATGKCSFNAVFDHIGDNRIVVTASYEGKKPTRIEHTVYYVPSADEYTQKAWALDGQNYTDLVSNIFVRSEKSQIYAVKGIVQYQVSENPQMVVVNSSEDGKSQPVLLVNKTKRKWLVGNYYRIYADADSLYNGMPLLYARYSFDK